MKLEAFISIWREGSQYIAHASPLDVATSGLTPESARAALDEAIDLFISTARENGTLDEMLEECGYENDGGEWRAPKVVSQKLDLLAV